MSLENKYFAELARRLRAAGITAGHPEKNRLTVLLNNQPVLSVSAGSDVFLLPAGSNQPEAGELYHKVAQTADEVYAYVEAVQTAPLLHASGLSEKFHLLADFGGAVLAGRELENGWGYQFVTWIWDHDRTGVSHGHYYEEDFQGAKQDFAVRSGLISKAQLFSPEELTQLYCLRCKPVPGDYQAYLTAFDLRVQRQNLAEQAAVIGRVTFASGEQQEYTDAETFLQCIRDELPNHPVTGFRYETLTDDPAIRKQVDDILYDLYGEENPRPLEDYENTPQEGMTMGGMT